MLSQLIPLSSCHIIIINNAVNQSWSCKALKYPIIHIIGVLDEHKEFVSWMAMHMTCNHIFQEGEKIYFSFMIQPDSTLRKAGLKKIVHFERGFVFFTLSTRISAGKSLCQIAIPQSHVSLSIPTMIRYRFAYLIHLHSIFLPYANQSHMVYSIPGV